MTTTKHGEMTVKFCPKCQTRLQHAAGIGDFCPNKDCRITDNILNPDEPLPQIVSPVESARQEGWKAGMEEAARWHDEQSEACVAAYHKTKDEWTGPDYSAEDNRANMRTAEEYLDKVPTHKGSAKAIRNRIKEGKD